MSLVRVVKVVKFQVVCCVWMTPRLRARVRAWAQTDARVCVGCRRAQTDARAHAHAHTHTRTAMGRVVSGDQGGDILEADAVIDAAASARGALRSKSAYSLGAQV